MRSHPANKNISMFLLNLSIKQNKHKPGTHRHFHGTRRAYLLSPSRRSGPSSLVHCKPRGISRGPQPPGRWGRIPKGTAFGIGSLWRFLSPISLAAKKSARRRRRDKRANRRDKRRIRRDVVDCPLRRGMTSQALRASSPKGEPSFAAPRAEWCPRCGGEVKSNKMQFRRNDDCIFHLPTVSIMEGLFSPNTKTQRKG